MTGSWPQAAANAEDAATSYINARYGFNPDLAARRRRGIPTTRQAVPEAIQRQADMGVDEYFMRPSSADLECLEYLEEVVDSPEA